MAKVMRPRIPRFGGNVSFVDDDTDIRIANEYSSGRDGDGKQRASTDGNSKVLGGREHGGDRSGSFQGRHP